MFTSILVWWQEFSDDIYEYLDSDQASYYSGMDFKMVSENPWLKQSAYLQRKLLYR